MTESRLRLVRAPRGMRGESRRLWSQLTAERITDPLHRRLLESGLRCLDIAETCRTAVGEEENAGQELNQLIANEVAARQAFLACCVALGLVQSAAG